MEAAPFLRTTSRHVLRKLRAQAAATRCAFWDRHTLRMRTWYAALPKGFLFSWRAAKSRARRRRRSQAQNFSTGFRSGDKQTERQRDLHPNRKDRLTDGLPESMARI